jgi:hypothetical protein
MIVLNVWSMLCCIAFMLLFAREDKDIFLKDFVYLINSRRSILYILISLLLLFIALPFTIPESIELWKDKKK